MKADFRKYHALGNDYIVIDPLDLPFEPFPDAVKAVCDRTMGAGSDGILLGPLTSAQSGQGMASAGALPSGYAPWLRIFNPDGSEAEKSGNGLRIFSLYLFERGYVSEDEFGVRTKGGDVRARVESANPPRIRVDMGEPSFSCAKARLNTELAEFVEEKLALGEEVVRATFVSMGNPHCVVFVDDPTPELAHRLGPIIERHPLFPRRTNVQFATVLDRHRIRIEIWERGAGYTLASGSSSCAAAIAAKRLGKVEGRVEVIMPGGTLDLDLSSPSIRMTGPAVRIYDGVFSEAMKATLTKMGAIGKPQ